MTNLSTLSGALGWRGNEEDGKMHSNSIMQKIQSSLDDLQKLASRSELALERQPLFTWLQRHQSTIATVDTEIQQRTAQLEQVINYQAMLGRIMAQVRDSLNENQILQTVVQELAQGLNLLGCDTTVYDWEMNATIVHRYGWQENDTITVDLAPGQVSQFCSLQHRHTVLMCPIIDHQEVFSDLLLYRLGHEAFNEIEIDFVQQVVSQCAIAIRQARLYQATLAQVKELERLNQAKDEFLSTVSFELRIPMANMKMAIQMLNAALEREFNQDYETSKPFRYLQVLQNECDREAKLIEDLLDLHQHDRDRASLIVSAEPLETWLPYIVEPLREKFQQQQLDLKIVIEPNLPLLMCDLHSLSRVILELLNNAYKYTPANECVIVSASKSSDLSDSELQLLEITVCNTGVEIPSTELERVFNKFYRIKSMDVRREGGTGLGLALVQKLMNYMNGEISVHSENLKTCFTLRLPIS